MAIINVIKFDSSKTDFAWKFPVTDLCLGSQLIVRPGQVAFFVKGGSIYDEFAEGTYTIESNNIPLLNKIVNLPFGNETPFQAEVWFINTLSVLDLKWGTLKPMMLEDCGYNIVVPVRAFGQYGIRINKPRVFFETLVGTLKSFTVEDVSSYFLGGLITRVSNGVAKKLVMDKTPLLKIAAYLQDLSEYTGVHLTRYFEQYGIELVNFFIMSINMPEDDSSVLALKKATEKRMLINTVGKDIYSFDRSMDVMEKAASNEGTGGDLIGAAMGLGMGFAVGPQLGKQFGQVGQQLNSSLNTSPPPLPSAEAQYFVYQNNYQYGPYTQQIIVSYIQQKLITTETYIWMPGMANWEKAGAIAELAALFGASSHTLPPPPTMGN